jgi:hypothetical protein
MGRWTLSAVAVALTFLVLCKDVGGQEAHGIDHVSFLAGCWSGQMGDLDMREQWSEAEGGIMLGTTRFFRDEVLVDSSSR